jgi:hypothetical protein
MKFVPKAVSRRVGQQLLSTREVSPSLLFGVGVFGMVGATVLACRATLKVEPVIETAQNDLAVAQEMTAEPEYTTQDHRETVGRVYVKSGLALARLYAPSVLLGAASIGCLTKSHNILMQRNAALTAAYIAVDQAFKEYRERVVDKYGEDQDREFRYESEVVEIITPSGKLNTELRVAPGAASQYARFFDEYSKEWSKEPEYNLVFLRCQQQWANDMLHMRGHMFLNEIYDRLGLERSQAGSVVGWKISDDGDNFIDFGIYTDRSMSATRDFVNGREGSVLLDFNVDGLIWDKIDEKGKERIRWQS